MSFDINTSDYRNQMYKTGPSKTFNENEIQIYCVTPEEYMQTKCDKYIGEYDYRGDEICVVGEDDDEDNCAQCKRMAGIDTDETDHDVCIGYTYTDCPDCNNRTTFGFSYDRANHNIYNYECKDCGIIIAICANCYNEGGICNAETEVELLVEKI